MMTFLFPKMSSLDSWKLLTVGADSVAIFVIIAREILMINALNIRVVERFA